MTACRADEHLSAGWMTTYFVAAFIPKLSPEGRTRTTKARGRDADLTAKECALLEYLARRVDEVVGRADIAEHVWDESYVPF